MEREEINIDLLKELYEGNITEEEAYDFLIQSSKDFHDGLTNVYWYNQLKLKKLEVNGNCSDCSLAYLAKWRYEGRPKICIKCGKKIREKHWGLICKEINGKEELVHVSCDDEYLRTIGYNSKDLKSIN